MGSGKVEMKIIETFRKNPLVLLAALVQSGAFALAGGVYFGPFGWALGAMAGIVVNLSLALAASRIADIAGKRKPLAYTSLAALMLLSPVAVAPAEYVLLIGNVALSQELCVVLALVWSTLPDWAILAAGGVIGKSLVAVETAVQTAPHQEGTAVALRRNGIRTAVALRRTAAEVRNECAALVAQYACKEPQCGWSPSADALIASAQDGKSARSAAASAKAGHVKNKHPKPALADALFAQAKDKQP